MSEENNARLFLFKRLERFGFDIIKISFTKRNSNIFPPHINEYSIDLIVLNYDDEYRVRDTIPESWMETDKFFIVLDDLIKKLLKKIQEKKC